MPTSDDKAKWNMKKLPYYILILLGGIGILIGCLAPAPAILLALYAAKYKSLIDNSDKEL